MPTRPLTRLLPAATTTVLLALVGSGVGSGLLGSWGPGLATAQASPLPAQSTWYPAYKDLHDPTLTYTQRYACSDFAPSGQSALYPYTVAEGVLNSFAWRNNSTSGVTVTANLAASNLVADAFSVTSLHVSGDYALKLSIECQSNPDPDQLPYVSPPALGSVGSTSASVGVSLTGEPGGDPSTLKYWVDYGTSYAAYGNRSPTQTASVAGSGATPETIVVPNLRPATAYHYRVEVECDGCDDSWAHSFSGADQTLTTAAASLGTTRRVVHTLEPATAPELRLTGSRSAGRRVALAAGPRRPAQGWILSSAGAHRVTHLVNERTGLCLDSGHRSPADRAAIVTSVCRRRAFGQQWLQLRTKGHDWRFINRHSHKALFALPLTRSVTQRGNDRDANARWTVR